MKKIILSSASLLAMTIGGFAMADTAATESPMMPKMEMKAQNPAIEKAIEAKDFTAFVSAVQGTPLAGVDTNAEFEAIVAMKAKMTAMQEKMKTIHTQLGLPTMEKTNATETASHDHTENLSMGKEMADIKKAIEAKDFAAFTAAAKATDFAKVDTQEKFNLLASAHAEMKALHEEMKALHTSLGITMTKEMKEMKNEHQDMKKEEAKTNTVQKRSLKEGSLKRADQKNMKKAITAGTYEAFVAATPANHPILEYVTKDNFSILTEIAAAKKSGDTAKMKTLMTSLGIDKKDAKIIKKMVK